jgi:threonine aldolase
MRYIDLRSDTVTEPTDAMRQAMANAPVGDDVYGEDPTVIQLQQEAAELFGQEAGLFVTSGTQGNLVSLLTHCERGAEILVGDKAHIFMYEAGGMAALGGIVPHIIPVQPDGTLPLDLLQAGVRGDNIHFPRTRLVTIENTQGTVDGVPLSAEYMHSVAEFAKRNKLKFHVDGARIFNAAAACGVSVQELTAGADSVTFCLSKGLGAPVGSVIVGSKAFIDEARRMRKILGGGLRQVGILAAAGLISLHEMRHRLHEDHANAAALAEGLRDVPGVKVLSQATNFVFFWLNEDAKLSPAQFQAALKERDILLSPYPGHERKFRCVTHYWITPERVQTVVQAVKQVLA